MGFYNEMAEMAKELLKPDADGGLGQGVIELTRITTIDDPDKPWEPPQEIPQTEVLNGAVSGISNELVGKEVGGTVLLVSDKQAICTVPTMSYQAGDTLSIDGKAVHIIAVENIPSAGTTVAVRFTIRG